jgi:hypothetical protein
MQYELNSIVHAGSLPKILNLNLVNSQPPVYRKQRTKLQQKK